MADPVSPSEKNFHVIPIAADRTALGIHSGHDDADVAERVCKQANAEAEKLGISTRYEVAAK